MMPEKEKTMGINMTFGYCFTLCLSSGMPTVAIIAVIKIIMTARLM